MSQKKIVLIVTDSRDYSIKEISEWLHYFSLTSDFKLVLLNTSKQKLQILKGALNAKSDLVFGISNTSIQFSLSSIKSIFIRQAGISIDGHAGQKSNAGSADDIQSRFSNYLMAYEASVRWLVLNCFSESNIIGYDSSGFINKLDVLKVAAEVGLKIPETILTTQKEDVVQFAKSYSELIIKSVGLGLAFVDLEEKVSYSQLSKAITIEDVQNFPLTFNLSMIQNRVDKKFEIRTFYLDEKCYSWALLSQSNDKTTVDYRNYDWGNPMRVVPFNLPVNQENLIVKLMKRLQLRTGSIDLIYSTTKEYIFLEVNPAGQYGYNSNCSNYELDMKIAQSLVFKHEENKHRVFHS